MTRKDAVRASMAPSTGSSLATAPLVTSSKRSSPIGAPSIKEPAVPVIPLVSDTEEPPPLLARGTGSSLPEVPATALFRGNESASLRRSTRSTKGVYQTTRYIDKVFLSSMDTVLDPDGQSAQLAYIAELFTCSDTGQINITDPRVYASKTPGTNADMPTFQQAMNGSEAAEYIRAMKLEVQTLVNQRTWESVPRPKDKPILKQKANNNGFKT